MNGYSSTSYSQGSGGIIVGEFGAVQYAENIVNNYFDALSESMQEAANDEQKKLREKAKSMPVGWSDIADNLTVTYDKLTGNFVYSVSGDRQKQDIAMSLEYGEEENAPTPLLRSASLKNAHDMGAQIDESLQQKLMEKFNG